jgi:Transposase zinc-binding domain
MPALEVADIFRRHGAAYRAAHAGHLGRTERRVMGAVEACRTAALGGHVECCAECGLVRISYNSCRDRHCPKCQGSARAAWLADRQAELLPVPYFHVVFTLPAPAAEIAFHTSVENTHARQYPIARLLYIYVNKKPNERLDPLHAQFIKFVLSRDGQILTQKGGYYPINEEIRENQLKKLAVATPLHGRKALRKGTGAGRAHPAQRNVRPRLTIRSFNNFQIIP